MMLVCFDWQHSGATLSRDAFVNIEMTVYVGNNM